MAIMSAISREYCGVLKYYGIEFDVHWDAETKSVFVTARKDRYAIEFETEYKADSTEDALIVAKQILKDNLWG